MMSRNLPRFILPRFILPLVLGAVLWISGCSGLGNSTAATPSPGQPLATETPADIAQNPVASPSPVGLDPSYASLPRLEGKATVEMTVKGAKVVMEIDGTNAPITAGNFVDLVNRGVYDGLVFHRVVRSPQPFVVQGGDPQGKDPNVPASALGTGSFNDPVSGAPRYIPLEIKPQGAANPVYGQTLEQAGVMQPPVLRHTRGALAMARSQLPNSASAQFYVALADLSFLDGSYAVFGYVTSGMEVVDQIQQGDRMETLKVTSGIENLRNSSGTATPATTPAATPAATPG